MVRNLNEYVGQFMKFCFAPDFNTAGHLVSVDATLNQAEIDSMGTKVLVDLEQVRFIVFTKDRGPAPAQPYEAPDYAPNRRDYQTPTYAHPNRQVRR